MPRTANNAPTSRKCSRSDHDKFVIRMPKGLRCAIAEVSRTNNRSMNSELVNRISQSLTSALADPGMASPAIQESDVIVSQVNTALAMRNKYLEDLLKTMPADIRSQEMATWHATISTSIF